MVARVVASDPRKNALLKAGNKSDRVDARKLSELLYLNKLNPVYHGEHGMRTLKELAHSYITERRSNGWWHLPRSDPIRFVRHGLGSRG